MYASKVAFAAFCYFASQAIAAPLPLGDDATLLNGDIANGVQVCKSLFSQHYLKPALTISLSGHCF